MSEYKKRYSLGEEIFNSVSHGVGVGLAIAGLVILVVYSAIFGDAYSVVSSAVYGSSLIILFLASTLYHSLTNKTAKAVFRILDHCSIFILIAGTYTPFALVTLRGPIGWTLFGVVWGAAVLGVVFNSIDLKKFEKLSLIVYVAMGWVVVFAIKPLMDNLALGGLILLIGGGVCYTGGILFYRVKKYKYMHSIWHLFVLAGSVLHFFSILFYVLPRSH